MFASPGPPTRPAQSPSTSLENRKRCIVDLGFVRPLMCRPCSSGPAGQYCAGANENLLISPLPPGSASARSHPVHRERDLNRRSILIGASLKRLMTHQPGCSERVVKALEAHE